MSQELQDKEIIYDAGKDKESRLVQFNDITCAYFNGENNIHRFQGKGKLEPLEIPEKIGAVHSIVGSNVLLVSGDKGYVIYDQDFKVLFEMTANYTLKAEVLFAER